MIHAVLAAAIFAVAISVPLPARLTNPLIERLLKSQLDSRIIGGVPASDAEFPAQVSLTVDGNLDQHFCGGSIISANYIVTAAHCIDWEIQFQLNRLGVVAGVTDFSDLSTRQVRSVAKYTLHSSWNANRLTNDIALLELETPLSLNSYVAAIGIATTAEDSEVVNQGNCIITGWGYKTVGPNPDSPTILKKADEMDIITNAQCTSLWSTSIPSSNICVNHASKGACNGDSGGPLFCPTSRGMVLFGATSWGREHCYTELHPSVYARASYYRSWISQNSDVNLS